CSFCFSSSRRSMPTMPRWITPSCSSTDFTPHSLDEQPKTTYLLLRSSTSLAPIAPAFCNDVLAELFVQQAVGDGVVPGGVPLQLWVNAAASILDRHPIILSELVHVITVKEQG